MSRVTRDICDIRVILLAFFVRGRPECYEVFITNRARVDTGVLHTTRRLFFV